MSVPNAKSSFSANDQHEKADKGRGIPRILDQAGASFFLQPHPPLHQVLISAAKNEDLFPRSPNRQKTYLRQTGLDKRFNYPYPITKGHFDTHPNCAECALRGGDNAHMKLSMS